MTLLNNCGFQFIIGIYSLYIIMDKEYRSSEKVELRDNTIEGYACVFGKPSDPALGFTEYIDVGSITDEVVNNSDILATYEHDFKQLLARSKFGEGSLQLSIDDNGLFFRFEIPDTQLGHDLKAMIQRGDLQGCSFCFAVADGGDEWDKDEAGNMIRHVTKIAELFDVTITALPAYPDTNVSLRALEKAKEQFAMADLEVEEAYFEFV